MFVGREVVEDHDIARAQRGDEDLLNIGEERGVIDGAVEDCRGRQAANA